MTPTVTTNPCRDLPPIVVNEGWSLYSVVCGCLWRTPKVNDRRSALQAHELHRGQR